MLDDGTEVLLTVGSTLSVDDGDDGEELDDAGLVTAGVVGAASVDEDLSTSTVGDETVSTGPTDGSVESSPSGTVVAGTSVL